MYTCNYMHSVTALSQHNITGIKAPQVVSVSKLPYTYIESLHKVSITMPAEHAGRFHRLSIVISLPFQSNLLASVLAMAMHGVLVLRVGN